MFKRFIDGLAFGAGFSIAFLVLWSVASFVVFPAFFESRFGDLGGSEIVFPDDNDAPARDGFPVTDDESFFAASIEEQIEKASAIALAEYEPSDDGRMRAIISEYLKLEPGTKLRYEVGDEHPSSSYYPSEDRTRRDAIVIFFTGSPATMRMSTPFDGERISGLNDIPLELFREKCTNDDG
jgi:hypothetical protein